MSSMSRLTAQIHRPILVSALRTSLLSVGRSVLRDNGSGYDMKPAFGAFWRRESGVRACSQAGRAIAAVLLSLSDLISFTSLRLDAFYGDDSGFGEDLGGRIVHRNFPEACFFPSLSGSGHPGVHSRITARYSTRLRSARG
jgi:hypothetical protein